VSLNALAIIFEFYNERLDVLASSFPIANASFCVAVEVLLLLVKQGLSLNGILVVLSELGLGLGELVLRLALEE